MNKVFQNYVSNVAFRISLSKTQIIILSLLIERGEDGCFDKNWANHRQKMFDRGCLKDNFIGAANVLKKKGLITHKLTYQANGYINYSKNPYRVTEAGHLVFKLCREAGLLHWENDNDNEQQMNEEKKVEK